jgi:hypothetical protein
MAKVVEKIFALLAKGSLRERGKQEKRGKLCDTQKTMK